MYELVLHEFTYYYRDQPMRVQGGKYFLNEMNEQTNHEVCFLLEEICNFRHCFHILCSEAYLEPRQTLHLRCLTGF